MEIAKRLGIDIVIATYNRPGAVDILAETLSKQCLAGDLIYIIYQKRSDKKEFDSEQIKSLYSSPPNLPKARNLGLKAGSNPIILFLDDDVIPGDKLLEKHRSCYNEPMIGCVAGFIDDPLFDKNEKEIPSRFDPSTGRLIQNFSINKSQYTISAMGANMSFRREALSKIGGFDLCFKRNALWEEIDCTFRLLKKKYKIWYNADAQVKHLRICTGGCREDTAYKYLYHSYANTAYFCCKYISGKYRRTWFKYWKYRLEYDTRIRHNDSLITRHNYKGIIAGLFGVLSGILRYILFGKHIGLPEQIDLDYRIVL